MLVRETDQPQAGIQCAQACLFRTAFSCRAASSAFSFANVRARWWKCSVLVMRHFWIQPCKRDRVGGHEKKSLKFSFCFGCYQTVSNLPLRGLTGCSWCLGIHLEAECFKNLALVNVLRVACPKGPHSSAVSQVCLDWACCCTCCYTLP